MIGVLDILVGVVGAGARSGVVDLSTISVALSLLLRVVEQSSDLLRIR
jgi:hypothetical protein